MLDPTIATEARGILKTVAIDRLHIMLVYNLSKKNPKHTSGDIR